MNNEGGWKTPSSVLRFGVPKEVTGVNQGRSGIGEDHYETGPRFTSFNCPLYTLVSGLRQFQTCLLVRPLFPFPLREKRAFFHFLALRRYSVSRNVKQCLLQNAWINSYLNRIIHSLISQHLVASVSSVVVKLKDTQLNLKWNQQKSRLPFNLQVLCRALPDRAEVILKALISSSFYRPF